MTRAIFKFNEVGRGLFYTGRIPTDNGVVNIIYDVVTSNIFERTELLTKRVADFVATLKDDETIDYLVLPALDIVRLRNVKLLATLLNHNNRSIKHLILPFTHGQTLLASLFASIVLPADGELIVVPTSEDEAAQPTIEELAWLPKNIRISDDLAVSAAGGSLWQAQFLSVNEGVRESEKDHAQCESQEQGLVKMLMSRCQRGDDSGDFYACLWQENIEMGFFEWIIRQYVRYGLLSYSTASLVMAHRFVGVANSESVLYGAAKLFDSRVVTSVTTWLTNNFSNISYQQVCGVNQLFGLPKSAFQQLLSDKTKTYLPYEDKMASRYPNSIGLELNYLKGKLIDVTTVDNPNSEYHVYF